MRIFVTLFVLAFLVGCEESGPAKDDPSYATDVQPLFDASCVSCHGGGAPAADYSLTSRAGALGPGSDTVTNVVPGSPESSRLFIRLDDGTMPPGGRWDSTRIAMVRNWIAKGAKDN